MSRRSVVCDGRETIVLEQGQGPSLVYLHGFADVHAAPADFQPFHQRLAEHRRVIAPAHPGCSGAAELVDGHSIDDVVFHYLELLDALDLRSFDLVGHCVGGWIAAELAVRHPERIRSLALIGACGLFVPGEPTGDIFMHSQPARGVDYQTLRALLFSHDRAEPALRFFPDGRADLDTEVRRYQMLRFGSFVGFAPPYFYSRPLSRRLSRASMPSLVVWGEKDRMTPVAHARAYAEGLRSCRGLRLFAQAGHAAVLEAPLEAAQAVLEFLPA